MTAKTLLHTFVMVLAGVFVLISIVRLAQMRTADDLLGLWDVDASGKLRFPPQFVLSGVQLSQLVFERNLHFRATDAPVKRPDLRSVLEDYGLEEANLNDIIRKNNLSQSPALSDQLLEIPLNNP